MKRLLLIAGLLLMILWGTGCVVIDVEELHSRELASVEPQDTMALRAGEAVCVDVQPGNLSRR